MGYFTFNISSFSYIWFCWSLTWIYHLWIFCNGIWIINWSIFVVIIDVVIVFCIPSICMFEPILFFWSISFVVDYIIFYYHFPRTHVCTYKVYTFFYIECIVIYVSIWVTCWIHNSTKVILTYVISKYIINSFSTTEHYCSTGVVVAIVVLIYSTITIVSIPSLSILVRFCVKGLIVLEDSIFWLPWPYTCSYSSESSFWIICWVDLFSYTIGYIVFN